MGLRTAALSGVALLWAASGGLAQEAAPGSAAEEAFRRIGMRLREANSVVLKSTVLGTLDGREIFHGSAHLFLQNDNKMNHACNVSFAGVATVGISIRMVSDGSRATTKIKAGSSGGSFEKPAPTSREHLERLAMVGLSGFLPSRESFEAAVQTVSFRTPLDTDAKGSAFAEGPGEGAAKSLSYTLKDQGESFDVKLWYDPKTYALLKRQITGLGGTTKRVVTETYETCSLNEKLAAENFVLPP
jgi:hypothetical protein